MSDRRGLLLAVDTSGPVGSVAVGRGSEVLACDTLTAQSGHAAGLIPCIDEVVSSAGLTLHDLDGLVVGEGPGSFTGVRVAAATVKGLARALGLRVWPVSSLAGAALTLEDDGVRYALFDARASRVYGACYEVGAGSVRTLVEPHAGVLDEVLGEPCASRAVFVGDAAEKHRDAIQGAGYAVAPPWDRGGELPRTIAEGLLRYLALEAGRDPIGDPGAWEPEYVRASSAERLWKP